MRQFLKALKALFLYFMGKLRGLFTPGYYGIKPGYRHRKKEVYWDDTGFTDEFQKEVYELARFHLDKNGYKKVVDIGCGSGYKLMHYFKDCDTVGIEVGKTVAFLQKQYPGRDWIDAANTNDLPKSADIIICADVIEHLVNPDELLNLINAMDFRLLFVSTPERKILRGWLDYGPPEHVYHIREWNAAEFRRYVGTRFQVISHQITDVESATQLLICRKK
jgi:2-polyprenyl-3-methyl-5-hydroxy-6-metoxy-1,4-benzoquinol methylase